MPKLSDEWDWDEYWDEGGPNKATKLSDYGMHIEYTWPLPDDDEDEDDEDVNEDLYAVY